MPRKPIYHDGKKYKTQKEFEIFVKNLIYNEIGICNDIKNIYPYKYKKLIKILQRHPEFNSKSKNICNLIIIKNKLNRNALEINIVKTNKEIIDISWRCAITGKYKTKKSDLMSAMRISIYPQIYEFKRISKNHCCELCGSISKLDVDHDDTKNSAFDELVYNFINENKDIKIPNKFQESNDNTHRKCFLEKDKYFKDMWIRYHYQHACLRILCHSCNISRPKTKNKLKL